jgi:hypothetical protein
MKAYTVTTGAVFGILVLAHLARLVAEGLDPAKNPWFVATTVIAASLFIWAWRLLRPKTRA